MSDEVVLDASVAVDWLLPGPRSAVALAFLQTGARRIAPDLIFAEFVSVAARFTRRGLAPEADARAAVERLPQLIDEVVALSDLSAPAYDLATRYGFSAYDAVYLAVALRRRLPLVTADANLARRAVDVGLAASIRLLISEP
ncbi:type II toxin-antitoxin system VapC family toxin [Caulobacter sp. LARHSG274]